MDQDLHRTRKEAKRTARSRVIENNRGVKAPADAPNEVAVAERDNRAMILAAEGVPYSVIAQQLGFSSHNHVRQVLLSHLERRFEAKADLVEAVRKRELARNEMLIQNLMARVSETTLQRKTVTKETKDGTFVTTTEDAIPNQDLPVLDRILKVQESTLKLMGIDKGVQHQTHINITMRQEDAISEMSRAIELAQSEYSDDE